MATTQINTFNIAVGSGNQSALPQPVTTHTGKKYTRIRARFTVVMTNSGSAYNMTSANVVTLMTALISNWYLSWGNAEEMAVDVTQPFAQMRLLLAQLEQIDFTVNNIQLNAVSGSTVQIAATGSTTTLTFEFIRSFVIRKTLNELHTFCPGPSQLAQIKLGITPSGSAAPTFNSGAVALQSPSAVPCLILFDDMDADSDQWSQVPILRIVTTPGVNIPLPVGDGGALLAVADLSAPASSYGLTLFNLTTAGLASTGVDDTFIQGLCEFAQAYSSYVEELGYGFDWSTLAAPLYWLPTANDIAHLDSVAQLNFYQPGNDITSPQLCVTFVPTTSMTKVQSAATNITATQGAVNLTNAVGAGGTIGTSTTGVVPNHVASVLPLQIRKPTDPNFNLAPHIAAVPNNPVRAVVPSNVLSAANSAVSRQPGGSNSAQGVSQLAKSTKAVTSAVPGWSKPGKTTGPTQAHTTVASLITTHGKTTQAANKKAASAQSRLANSHLLDTQA
jgi:hypothetical protein